MSNKKQEGRILFQTQKHHRQILRSQIDPSLIERIEIDKNPSLNYRNAYKNLYNDELQKTVLMVQERKNKNKSLYKNDSYLSSVGTRQGRLTTNDRQSMSTSRLVGCGQRFVDFDEEKAIKYQNHVERNYDGGQSFFRAHDQHLQKKKYEADLTNKTINNQLQIKEYMKMQQQQKIREQQRAFQELKYRQFLQDQQRLQNQKYQKQTFRQNMVKQIQQQKVKKQRKSKFQFQNIARHNPITNPIEYHIDNPYILREIQNRNLVRNQSDQQFFR